MFTIVITTYNRLPLLKRAIRTSLEQTIACEVIVVDDGSTDGTEAYCERLAQTEVRFCYLRNEQNRGHSYSVNRGVELAQGDWVKFLDDDDYLALDCVAVLEDAIALCPDAVICSCQAAQVNEQEDQLSLTVTAGPGEICRIPQADIHYGMLIEAIPFGTPVQVAVRRQAFLQTGGWDSELDTNFDDIDSWLKVAEHGDALLINRCLSYRTVWPGAYNYRLSLRDRLHTHIEIKHRIYERIAPVHRAHCPPFRQVAAYLRLHWGLVAFRQRQWRPGLAVMGWAITSVGAWRLLWRSRYHRAHLTASTRYVTKEVLRPA
ncbi:glycosyltransferase family 2 protein [Spirulina major]|uniref:glycosyltransferase family 2 protein n=1 Tax=Spirulina major TaxID=270636 RepID=UPI00093464A6|nr:glycosyltransferase [Spirulina major]